MLLDRNQRRTIGRSDDCGTVGQLRRVNTEPVEDLEETDLAKSPPKRPKVYDLISAFDKANT